MLKPHGPSGLLKTLTKTITFTDVDTVVNTITDCTTSTNTATKKDTICTTITNQNYVKRNTHVPLTERAPHTLQIESQALATTWRLMSQTLTTIATVYTNAPPPPPEKFVLISNGPGVSQHYSKAVSHNGSPSITYAIFVPDKSQATV
ncbi:uncharacterized protein DFL_005534 [Arthrobotrys flagrans]|uniref:Uncharacterized protein n=1 Tax=Arthrobotrys flagrans TaxID=97331 RepID=A0A436ZYD9_ARTFL|nr:hypothetical protein DFL_005534 [Arthrobotrys flagrans]